MQKWNCDKGVAAGQPWKGEGGGVYALALSPDGKTIACGREDGSVQRWTTDGEMVDGVWAGHSNRVRSLSWSPSGNHLASGSSDGTILIRKAESGEVVLDPIDGADRCVESCIFTFWRENCIRRVEQINLHLEHEDRKARCRPHRGCG